MAVVEIHPQNISGLWKWGVTFDLHTTSSTPIGENQYGHMQFDTVRPAIAQLLYRLKYQGDQSAAADIIDTAVNYFAPYRTYYDLMIPVPPSTARMIQPVLLLATGIGAGLNMPVVECVTATRARPQLKGVTDPNERKQLLEGLYSVEADHTRGKNILLFDDLFRSGATMNAITDVLLHAGEAASVSTFTITKTRSNQ